MPAHERKVSEDHSPTRMKMCALVFLYFPTRVLQRLVDMFAGLVFQGWHAQAPLVDSGKTRSG
jgi:hypothetical protein